jgi:hypothetical protein
MDKESWRRGGDPRPDPRGETSLDELAKGMANGNISRRQALRWMGGALVGGVLASIPGVALAQEGNSACDEFCHANFSGRAAGQCTSAGARGAGPCYTCTPGIGPGPHFTPPPCGPNEEFNPETCECVSVCPEPIICGVFTPLCGPGTEACVCVESVEGTKICGADPCGPPCTSDAECEALVPGAICQAPNTGCCGQTCIFPCGEAPLTVSSGSTNSGG